MNNASFVTPTALCPHCGHAVDRASPLGKCEGAPAAGDFTLCIECGSILQFDAVLRLTTPDPAEFKRLQAKQPDAAAALRKGQLLIWSLPSRPPGLRVGQA